MIESTEKLNSFVEMVAETLAKNYRPNEQNTAIRGIVQRIKQLRQIKAEQLETFAKDLRECNDDMKVSDSIIQRSADNGNGN